jgi:hypothetical protein
LPVEQSIKLAVKLKQVLGEEGVTLKLPDGAEHGDASFETH